MRRHCRWPHCPVVVEAGYCPEHFTKVTATKNAQTSASRATTAERGYGARWQARAERFKRKYPLCGMRPNGVRPVMSRCFDEGRVTAAFQVDHVVPHKGNQALFWDELGNWQSLCASCGAAKSRAGL